jgi:hypothetical protein
MLVCLIIGFLYCITCISNFPEIVESIHGNTKEDELILFLVFIWVSAQIDSYIDVQ